MNVLFNQEQLLRLVSNLYTLTGIRANILDTQGHDICLSSDHAPFCERINATPEGHARCVACDARAVKLCADRNSADSSCLDRNGCEFYCYRCHAGICEAILPIRTRNGEPPLAYLICGQFLDDSPLEEQWENCRRTLDWWPANDKNIHIKNAERRDPARENSEQNGTDSLSAAEELRQDFFQFRQYTKTELRAYLEILEALSSYIQQKEMILAAELTDLQKLSLFLDQHYKEKLSLASISSQLHIGRTKLCQLAKELSGGKTLSWLITQRRISTAKTLLLQSDQSISSVAEAVGIGDYNYFTKLFRAFSGCTPSAYRKMHRHQ